MIFDQQNRLPKPEVVAIEPYTQALATFKNSVVAYLAQSDEALAQEVAETIGNEAELITKIIEACVYVQQTRQREINNDALQMFVNWATGSNLDAKVRDLGLTRQLIKRGDPSAFPAVPDEYESDEDLRARYFLTLLGFSTAGAEYAYIYHCMTLGQRPKISVHNESETSVVVRYEFDGSNFAGQVKGASVQRPAPGEILLTILSRESDGTPSDALITFIESYFQRGDVAPSTDKITVQKVTLKPYTLEAVLYVRSGASPELIVNDARKRLDDYVEKQKTLGAIIEPTFVGHLLHSAGAERYTLNLVNPVVCSKSEAPMCTGITLTTQLL